MSCLNCKLFLKNECPNRELHNLNRQTGFSIEGDYQICEKFETGSHGNNDVKKGKQRTMKLTAGVLNNVYFESIIHHGKPCFLVNNSGEFKILPEVEAGEEKIIPLETGEIPYPPYQFYEGSVSLEELYSEVYNKIDTFIDVEEVWKHVFTACILLTYQQEKLQSLPYLFLVGDNESGKTMVLDVFYYLAYRPMKGTSFPAADIYTYLEHEPPSCILEDELGKIEKDQEKIKIYKIGYKRPGLVPRIIVNPLTGKRTIKYYNAFCFKAVANEKLVEDKGFMERFLVCQMVEGTPQKDEITSSDIQEFSITRNKLLKWKLLTVNNPLPELYFEWLRKRLKELWKPLLQVIYGLPGYEKIKNFLYQVYEQKNIEKSQSLEGILTKVVYEKLQQNHDTSIPFTEIWVSLTNELNGEIDTKNPDQMYTETFGIITKNLVGRRLREALGGVKNYTKTPDRRNMLVYMFNRGKVEKAVKKYHVEVLKLLASDTSNSIDSLQEDVENKTSKKAFFEEIS